MSGPHLPLNATHLGDGVYVCIDEYSGLWLRANDINWGGPTPSVCLEPEIVRRLVEYAERVGIIQKPRPD